MYKDLVVFDHDRTFGKNTFSFDVSIVEPTGQRRMVHSKKRQNKGMCESDEEKAQLFAHIDAQLAVLRELDAK